MDSPLAVLDKVHLPSFLEGVFVGFWLHAGLSDLVPARGEALAAARVPRLGRGRGGCSFVFLLVFILVRVLRAAHPRKLLPVAICFSACSLSGSGLGRHVLGCDLVSQLTAAPLLSFVP